MNLTDLQRHWNAFGEQDPMWAILTDPARKGRRWDADEFFGTGRDEIAGLMREAATFQLPRQRRRALDFGCGVGRLTQALAAHAEAVVGLDVAPSMIAQARAFNRHGPRVEYRVQAGPPFDDLADRSVDLVYTGRVLQHIAPEYSRRYIGELARVLAPGGFLSFDVPSRPLDAPALPTGALPAAAYHAQIRIVEHTMTEADGAVVVTVHLQVTNAGTEPWPAGAPINVGNHWLAADGAVVLADDQRVAVPLPLAQGATVPVRFSATVPPGPGACVLELDVVHEGVSWFGWTGSPTTRLDLASGASATAAAAGPEPSVGESAPDASAAAGFEPVMEMHAVHRDDVEALLRAAGVRLLRVRQEHHCGPRWEAFRYDVTAD